MTMDEDYAYEHLRQKRIDDMSEKEFAALFNKATQDLDPDDQLLKQLEDEAYDRKLDRYNMDKGCYHVL